MFEDLMKVLAVLLLSYAFFIVFLFYRKNLQFYKTLGAKIERIFPLRASLQKADKRYTFKFGGYHGLELIITTNSPVMGYLILEFKRRKLQTVYDDEDWAKTILNASKLSKLAEVGLNRLLQVNIKGTKIELVFNARQKDDRLVEEIGKALEFMDEVIDSLKGLPNSALGLEKERLRKWLIYHIPIGVFLVLSFIGLFSGYAGDALCEDNLFVLGLKVLTPLFLAHFLLTILILKKHLQPKINIPILLVLYFAGYGLIPKTILDPFNAMLDRSEPVRVETRIVDKYYTFGKFNRGFKLKLEGLECPHRVSEGLYKEVKVGDSITLFVKQGAFGVKWVERYL